MVVKTIAIIADTVGLGSLLLFSCIYHLQSGKLLHSVYQPKSSVDLDPFDYISSMPLSPVLSVASCTGHDIQCSSFFTDLSSLDCSINL